MTATAPDSHDRLPTTGPEEAAYRRYRFVSTMEGEAIIYDAERPNAWLQAETTVVLEAWR